KSSRVHLVPKAVSQPTMPYLTKGRVDRRGRREVFLLRTRDISVSVSVAEEGLRRCPRRSGRLPARQCDHDPWRRQEHGPLHPPLVPRGGRAGGEPQRGPGFAADGTRLSFAGRRRAGSLPRRPGYSLVAALADRVRPLPGDDVVLDF